MTLLLGIMFVPVFNSYKSDDAIQIAQLESELKTMTDAAEITMMQTQITDLKDPLETKRILYLSGALLVVLGGLSIAGFSAKRDSKGWGADRKSTRLNSSHVAISYAV